MWNFLWVTLLCLCQLYNLLNVSRTSIYSFLFRDFPLFKVHRCVGTRCAGRAPPSVKTIGGGSHAGEGGQQDLSKAARIPRQKVEKQVDNSY